MFEVGLYEKKRQYKGDEADQNPIAALVMFFVKLCILTVNVYHCRYKNYNEEDGKSKLACGKHVEIFFWRSYGLTRSLAKFIT
ncbi:MAG: hypothetical protein ACO1N9_10995 [Flavobacterium sp.]